MAYTCNTQSHSKFRLQEKFEVGIYFKTTRENIAYCSPVGNVVLFGSNCGVIADFQ